MIAVISGLLTLTCCRPSSLPTEKSRITEALLPYQNIPGVGVCVITDAGDTIGTKADSIYPMMSVFKMHQALALLHCLDSIGAKSDTLLHIISSEELHKDTWSPLAKEGRGDEFDISVRELLAYTMQQSDNNACDILFNHLYDVAQTDRFTASLSLPGRTSITQDENAMHRDSTAWMKNYCTPKAAAALVWRIFNDSIVSPQAQQELHSIMLECRTGQNRIPAMIGNKISHIGHKTGTGDVIDGIVTAINDVAYIKTKSGREYALAVFIHNFHGSPDKAEVMTAEISAAVCRAIEP